MAFRASVSKPKLSLNVGVQSTRPTLSLKSPVVASCPRTPISPSPISPTARNTRLNRKGYTTYQAPSYAYANNSGSKSILKKSASTGTTSKRSIQIEAEPTVYCVTPIEAGEEYYGGYVKMSRDERRWGLRS